VPLQVNRIIREDDYTGTVRRTIRSAIFQQVAPAERPAALAKCRSIRGGCLVRHTPPGATSLKYEKGGIIIPVDETGKLVIV